MPIEPRDRFDFDRELDRQLMRLVKSIGFRDARGGIGGGKPGYEPTAEEIRSACAEIRLGWDRREELTRRSGTNRRVPCVVRLVKVAMR